jgi:uncharacterized cupin superfamily protein
MTSHAAVVARGMGKPCVAGCDDLSIDLDARIARLGERELREGDVVAFPRGPRGAHAVANRTGEAVRILIVSTKGPLDVVHYPDSGKLGVWTAEHGYVAITPEQPDVQYWDVDER